MDFEWTPEHQAFRDKLRAFLKAELPDNWESIAHHGPGSAEITAFSRQFCARLAEAGMLFPHWPVSMGGQGLDAWYQTILAEEMWAAGEPRGAQYMNVNWIGPTVMKYGSEEQKKTLLPQIVAGNA